MAGKKKPIIQKEINKKETSMKFNHNDKNYKAGVYILENTPPPPGGGE